MTVEAETLSFTHTDGDRFQQAGRFIVIGATGGIGRAVCRMLRERDASVTGLARTPDDLSELSDELQGVVSTDAIDATDFDAVESAVAAAAEDGRVAGIVNCVGSILLKPAHMTSRDEYMDAVHLNLTTAFGVVRAAGKHLTGGGSVVLLSSAAADVGLANHEAIAAVKAGVAGLTRSAAATYAPRGLRFNAVAPGMVRTQMTERITSNPKSLEASKSMHPMQRIGEPEDIASAILWLLDPANAWVTGQIIGVDGGLACARGRPSA